MDSCYFLVLFGRIINLAHLAKELHLILFPTNKSNTCELEFSYSNTEDALQLWGLYWHRGILLECVSVIDLTDE